VIGDRLPASLIALGSGIALALPAQAASSWSPPVQLPGACGGSVAVNAAGAQVAAGFQQNADGGMSVQVCTSTDGQNWPAPVTLGQGVSPTVAIAPDGRAVAVWEGGPGTAATVQASVRPPGGQWSTAVTLTTDFGHPVIGIDRSGNAIAAWAAFSGPIETAGLPAGGTWTAVKTLAARGQAVNLAVNLAGAAIVTWAATLAASGTVLGGFAAPVSVSPPPPYPIGYTRVVLNDAGQAALAWATGTNNMAATRSADGTWSTAVKLSGTRDGPVDVAIDGAGDAIAVFGQIHVSGTSTTATVYTSRHPASDTWGRRPCCPCPVTTPSPPRRRRCRRDFRRRLGRQHDQYPERGHQPARRRLRARRRLHRCGDQRPQGRPRSCGAVHQTSHPHRPGEHFQRTGQLTHMGTARKRPSPRTPPAPQGTQDVQKAEPERRGFSGSVR
jgi:hypothetical protein